MASKPKPKNAPTELTKKQPAAKKKTVGNPLDVAKDPSDLLRQIQKLDGNLSGVFKNGADVLKKIRDITQMTTGTGAASMAAGALASALGQVAGSSGSAAAGSALAAAAALSDPTDQVLQDALAEAQRQIAVITRVESYIKSINDHVAAIIAYPALTADNLFNVALILDLMVSEDLQSLPQETIINLFDCFRGLILCIDYVKAQIPPGFPYSHLGDNITHSLLLQDFRGLDKPTIIYSGDPLTAAMRASLFAAMPGWLSCADTVDARLREVDEFDDVEQIVNESIDAIIADLENAIRLGHLTLAFLQEIIARLLALLAQKGNNKVFGAQPSSGNAASMIPAIGGMIQSTVKQFLPRSINDIGKIVKSLDKYTKNQAVAQKVKEQAQTKLNQNPKPQPEILGGGDGAATETIGGGDGAALPTPVTENPLATTNTDGPPPGWTTEAGMI